MLGKYESKNTGVVVYGPYFISSYRSGDFINVNLIYYIYKFKGLNRIVAGKIESGSLKEGDSIVIYPEKKKNRIKALEFFGKKKETVSAGDSIGLTFEDEQFIQRATF